MRSIISLLMALALMFSNVAFAANNVVEDFEALLNKPFTCGNMKMEFTAKLDAPLDKSIDPDGEISKAVDGFKVDFSLDTNANTESTVMQAAGVVNFEVADQKNNMQMWIDLDASNEENIKYNAIMKYPDEISDKYMVLDYTKMPGFDKMLESMLENGFFDTEKAAQLNSELFKNIEKPEVTYKDGVYTAVLSEADVKAGIDAVLKAATELLNNMTVPMTDGENVDLNSIAEAIKAVKIFDTDKAIEITAKADEAGKIEMNYKLNIDANAADITAAFNSSTLLADENPISALVKEKSGIKGSILMNMVLTPAEKVEITFPELTADNSIDMLEMMNETVIPELDETKINVLYNNVAVIFENDPIIRNDRTFVPIRKLANAFGIGDEDIAYNAEDETVTIKNGDVIVKLTIGSDKAFIGETETILDEAAFTFEDRTYLPLRFVSEAFGKKVDYTQFTDENGQETGGLITIGD